MRDYELLMKIEAIQKQLLHASDTFQHAQDELVELWEEIAGEPQTENMYDNP